MNNRTVIGTSRRRMRNEDLMTIILAVVALILVGVIVFLLFFNKKDNGSDEIAKNTFTASPVPLETPVIPDVSQEPALPVGEASAKADRLAKMYDYDGAIEVLKASADYAQNDQLKDLVAKYTQEKSKLVKYPTSKITHVFFHSMIKDNSRAFDGEYTADGYNQVMATLGEFNNIMQEMYDRGFVMVRLQDIASMKDGKMVENDIMLPEGKQAFVLSQDDLNYYHYMEGDGFASRLVLRDGKVKCEYIEKDGTLSYGDFDMVPAIDTFVEQHPDFSYRGAKGIVALTGYDGVMGYRTDVDYKTQENLSSGQKKYMAAHPDFNYDEEVKGAKAVAEAMKANGWEFASHSWGHVNMTTITIEKLKIDTQRWLDNVANIIGKTEILLFPFGADIGTVKQYNSTNEKYQYLKSVGFNYYCNVDSNQYWCQLTSEYFRQGRRNIDGYRMFYNPEKLSDLFEVSKIFDKDRPTPVKPM